MRMLQEGMARLAFCCSNAVAVALCATALVAQTPGTPTGAGWTRFGWDPGRSNVYPASTGLTGTNLASLSRQQVQMDGEVDASPIYLRGVIVGDSVRDAFFVTTTYGKTVAIDADTGSILWTYTPPDYTSWAGSRQITSATPVADDDGHFIYAASPDGRIQKLAVEDGRPIWRTAITLLPQREKIAAALNYFDGRVIATTGGYVGDAPPYQGHVAILDAATGALQHVWNSLCSDRPGLLDPRGCAESDSAIWGRAGAVVDVATRHLFVATGNGRWDGRTYWGDATLELDLDATRLLGAYTPANTDELWSRDLDIGSSAPVLLGDGLLLQGGKDHQLRLLSIDQMRRDAGNTGGELQIVTTPAGGGLFAAPAVWHTGGSTWIFVTDGSAIAGWLLRDGLLQQQWRVADGGTSPVVAGGLLYVYDPHGVLRALEPASGRELAAFECGTGHWNSPIVVDGRIAVTDMSVSANRLTGTLYIWRLPGSAGRARRRM